MAYPNTSGEIKTEVLVQLGVDSTIAYFTDAHLNRWLDKAHKWAAGMHQWPVTQGKVSTTYASLVTNEEGDLEGEYPEGWKSDSIRYLNVGGKKVKKIMFSRFRQLREEQADNDSRVFTDFGRLYLLNPQADVSGTITAWGNYTPADIDGTDPDVTTVFSDTEIGNEAIIEKMISYGKERQLKVKEARFHHDQAVEILNNKWQKWKDEQYDYEDHNVSDGQWTRIDYATGLGVAELNNRDRFY